MAAIVWSEMMRVGVPVLDADHKTLVGLVNNLHRSVGDHEEYAILGSVLAALVDYVEHHFAREERVMEVCAYPALETHAQMHRRLAKRVSDLKGRYDNDRTAVRARDCLDFLHQWLIEHICSADMDYRVWVIGHTDALEAAESVTITGMRPGAGLDWKALRVLVVDDNQNFIQVMRTILEGVGVVEIRSAGDLATAQAALQAAALDVVVVDWQVDGESGLDLVSWVRRQPGFATLPVLVLSGPERIDYRDMALRAGAGALLEKPISARGLLIGLARLLRNGTPPREQ